MPVERTPISSRTDNHEPLGFYAGSTIDLFWVTGDRSEDLNGALPKPDRGG